MINFIDENGRRHGALAEVSERKAVNGEKSLSGTVYTNDEVIHGIDKGWKIYFNNEYYVITFAVPVDNGDSVEIEFDAVHEFFYEFSKSVVYDLLEGSNTMISYLDFIFADSGYSYDLEIDVPAFSKESFGMENRLSLFKDVIKSTGVEFSVNNRVVRILRQVGTDLSTVVKKGFNMQELRLEKNINDFITYKRGFGRFDNEDDPSLGRLEAEYESPLAAIYGRLEGDPVIDERYSVLDNLIDRLEQEVESSYSISVQLTMEDLTKAGYQYKQPREGDYISAINERLGFHKKIRIVSYESYYDSNGQLVDHRVTCNSLGIVDKLFSNDAGVRATANQALKDAQKSLEVANHALVSADGKSINYYGETDPVELGHNVRHGDRWYQTIGEETKLKYWNGAEWQENKVSAGSLAGVLDVKNGDVDLINVNVANIVGNTSTFIKSGWNDAVGGNVNIDGSGVTATSDDGAQSVLQNGVLLTRTPSGATTGYLGYDQSGGDAWVVQTLAQGANYRVRGHLGNEVYRSMIDIYPGANDIFLNAEDVYSTGILRAEAGARVTGELRIAGDNNIVDPYGIYFLHGGAIYTVSTNSQMRIDSTQSLVLRTNTDSTAMTFDSTHAYLDRTLSMNGNNITNQSDIRLKTNVENSGVDALKEIDRMKFIDFDWDLTNPANRNKQPGRKFGIVAQYSPFLQTKTSDSESYLSVDMTKQVNLNSKALQEMNRKVNAQQKEIDELKILVNSLIPKE